MISQIASPSAGKARAAQDSYDGRNLVPVKPDQSTSTFTQGNDLARQCSTVQLDDALAGGIRRRKAANLSNNFPVTKGDKWSLKSVGTCAIKLSPPSVCEVHANSKH